MILPILSPTFSSKVPRHWVKQTSSEVIGKDKLGLVGLRISNGARTAEAPSSTRRLVVPAPLLFAQSYQTDFVGSSSYPRRTQCLVSDVLALKVAGDRLTSSRAETLSVTLEVP